MTQEQKIEQWAKMYESTIDESFGSKYRLPTDVAKKIEDEDQRGAIVKIVVGNKFYDIKDIYTIDDDDSSSYVCIEAEEKK